MFFIKIKELTFDEIELFGVKKKVSKKKDNPNEGISVYDNVTDLTSTMNKRDDNNSFYEKFINNKNTINFQGLKFIKQTLDNLWDNENSFFVKFLKSEGKLEFKRENSIFPELFDLLEKEDLNELNETFLNEKVIELPSKTKISRREMFLLRETISKKFKNTTDVNCKFLDDLFSYLFGDYYDNKYVKSNLDLKKNKIYYCPCKGVFLNKEKKLFTPQIDNCPSCNKKILGENRIDCLNIKQQLSNLLNRDELRNKVITKQRNSKNIPEFDGYFLYKFIAIGYF